MTALAVTNHQLPSRLLSYCDNLPQRRNPLLALH